MPLSEKVRIEVYLPDLPRLAYKNLLESFYQELTYIFGGYTIVHGLYGSYLSRIGRKVQDRVNIIYTDTPFSLVKNLRRLSRYLDELRAAAYAALEEETVLVVAFGVYHADSVGSEPGPAS